MNDQIGNTAAAVVAEHAVGRTADRCLYCGGREWTPLYQGIRDRLRYVPGEWSFVRCADCGSAVLSPFPSESELAGFYPPVYSFCPQAAGSRWRRALAWLEYNTLYRPMYEGDARRVLRHTLGMDVAGKSLLDVGCGRGHRLLAFRRRGCQVTGADFQPQVVQYVQGQLGIPACCCGVEDLVDHFTPGSFDLVTAFYVLEHVLDVQQVLRSCFHLLKPGGWLAAAVPLVDSWQAAVFGSRWSQLTEAPRHISLPSRCGIQASFQQAGLSGIIAVADSIANCAGAAALTVVPGGTTPAVYGQSGRWQLPRRCFLVAAAMLAAPWCALDNLFVRRPAFALVFGRKPVCVEGVA